MAADELTGFVCVLIGDVTGLIDSLVGGKLTVRFLVNSVTIGVIAGTAFRYDLTGLRRDEEARS